MPTSVMIAIAFSPSIGKSLDPNILATHSERESENRFSALA
jgi:hypothetical protein